MTTGNGSYRDLGWMPPETPRNISFCGHAILQNDTFICLMQKDERFGDNPLVTGKPFIRFYAGQPVYSNKVFALGTLCLIDDTPRSFSAAEAKALKDFPVWSSNTYKVWK